MNETNLWIITQIIEELKGIKKSKEYFSKSSDFTRDRVFTFETVFFLIADLPRKSLCVEVEKGLKVINSLLDKNEEGTKGGFCRARKKILPELFQVINDKLLEQKYNFSKGKALKRWEGFLLRAIDGAIIDMIDTEDNRRTFGVQENQHVEVVQGRMMIGYDVLNNFVTHGYLGKLSIGESNVVKPWISKMSSDELNIYDRLFPGIGLQYLHHYYNSPYVMRCKSGHNKEIAAFIKSKKKEKITQWALNDYALKELRQMGIKVERGMTIPVRMIRIKLDNGEIEVLITSLVDQQKFPHKVFKVLYFKRWGVETQIGFLKNTLQIEITSGRSVKTIYQDFYATIFRANVQALIEQDCANQLKLKNQNRKHNYAINRTAAAGNLKEELPKLFLGKTPKEIYDKLIKVFIKNLEPVRPNRNFPRIKKSQKLNGKYKPFMNYKRAV